MATTLWVLAGQHESIRDVEVLLARCGIEVSREAVRCWVARPRAA